MAAPEDALRPNMTPFSMQPSHPLAARQVSMHREEEDLQAVAQTAQHRLALCAEALAMRPGARAEVEER